MKSRIAALLLSACLLLTTPALAVSDSSANFVRSRSYAGQFSDLSRDSVFYSNVTALYEYGLSVGKADGTFGMQDSVTVGQMLIFAGRIRSLYRTGDAEAGAAAYASAGSAAYLPYLTYLQQEGILGNELDGSYVQPATRAQVAHILANALPSQVLPAINDTVVTEGYATHRYIRDVTEYTPYYRDILALYRMGLSAGSDSAGAFLPERTITRGAAAAMLTRMLDADLRITLDWDISDSGAWSAEGTTLADLVPKGAYVAAPVTTEEITQSVLYMLSLGSNTLYLQYPSGVTAPFARTVMQQALEIVKTYCEQCYNTVNCTFSTAGDLTLIFSAGSAGDNIQQYRTETMEAAITVHDLLWANGTITAQSTEKEKALAYYTWICENCVYDYQASETSLSHIAYSLFHNGRAVCDGYTGAYNLLLKLEGIRCSTIFNSSHIWTVATLDGTEYHIDTTWGDTGDSIHYEYFAMSPQQSWNYHSW